VPKVMANGSYVLTAKSPLTTSMRRKSESLGRMGLLSVP
jgi:hypothetical protein